VGTTAVIGLASPDATVLGGGGWKLVVDSPYYPTFVFEKLKMEVVIFKSEHQ
jgi:hypothetical protein